MDGIEAKWCILYIEWGNHYREGHPTGNVAIDMVEGAKSNEVIETLIETPPALTEVNSETVESDAVARLRKAGLLS